MSNTTPDVILIPNSLYYVRRASAVLILQNLRDIAAKNALFFLRSRTIKDYRYGRGEEIERNTYRLTLTETGEQGAINVFYYEHELVDMLREHLGADPETMELFALDYQNAQQGLVVPNSDVVIWGHLGP